MKIKKNQEILEVLDTNENKGEKEILLKNNP